jgi:membrane protease YdiL (CAAX protease family)
MTVRKLLIILIFSMVIRGSLNVLGIEFFGLNDYYVEETAGLVMFVLLYLICIKEFRITKNIRRDILGIIRTKEVAFGAVLGIVLLLFAYGEGAAETLLLAQFDRDLAYDLGHFHIAPYASMPLLSAHVGYFLLASVLAPAIVEEFYFRSLLVKALSKRRSFLRSALISSMIFTAVHPYNGVYLSTFLFAIVSCFLYARTGSLYPSIAMHFSHNLFAFITDYFFDFREIRSIDEISSISNWIPEFIMLNVSVAALGFVAFRYFGTSYSLREFKL